MFSGDGRVWTRKREMMGTIWEDMGNKGTNLPDRVSYVLDQVW